MAGGFESYKASQLRETLVRNGWTEEEAAGCTGKSNLVHEIVKIAAEHGISATDLVEGNVAPVEDVEKYIEDNDLVTEFDLTDVEYEEDNLIGDDKPDGTAITYGHPLWSEHVIAQLSDEELINGNPTVSGLRRVAEILLGAVTFSGPIDVKVHYPENPLEIGRATVTYSITFAWAADNPWLVEGPEMALPTRTFSAVAGSYLGNTDDMFSVYPEAIAETRAEGRALRKALGLKTVSHEEITDKDVMESVKASKTVVSVASPEWTPSEEISANQKHLIDAKCRAMDINVMKFINKMHVLDPDKYPKNFDSIDKVPRGIASEMVKELTKYQSEADDESKEIPEAIIGYEE